jgi:hypothetical protein
MKIKARISSSAGGSCPLCGPTVLLNGDEDFWKTRENQDRENQDGKTRKDGTDPNETASERFASTLFLLGPAPSALVSLVFPIIV